jgi:hypothetical protein
VSIGPNVIQHLLDLLFFPIGHFRPSCLRAFLDARFIKG